MMNERFLVRMLNPCSRGSLQGCLRNTTMMNERFLVRMLNHAQEVPCKDAQPCSRGSL